MTRSASCAGTPSCTLTDGRPRAARERSTGGHAQAGIVDDEQVGATSGRAVGRSEVPATWPRGRRPAAADRQRDLHREELSQRARAHQMPVAKTRPRRHTQSTQRPSSTSRVAITRSTRAGRPRPTRRTSAPARFEHVRHARPLRARLAFDDAVDDGAQRTTSASKSVRCAPTLSLAARQHRRSRWSASGPIRSAPAGRAAALATGRRATARRSGRPRSEAARCCRRRLVQIRAGARRASPSRPRCGPTILELARRAGGSRNVGTATPPNRTAVTTGAPIPRRFEQIEQLSPVFGPGRPFTACAVHVDLEHVPTSGPAERARSLPTAWGSIKGLARRFPITP